MESKQQKEKTEKEKQDELADILKKIFQKMIIIKI